jgi:predicted esterase
MKKKYFIFFTILFFYYCTTPDILDIDPIPPKYNVITEYDIVYSSAPDADGNIIELKMDIYYPDTDDTERRPLIIMIHGGSFREGFGSKESCRKWARIMAGKGYIVSSIQYRLWRGKTSVFKAIKAAIFDAEASVRYFKANADKWNINPLRIMIGGYSAGASTALYAAYNPDFKGNDNNAYSEYPGDVFAVFSLSGAWGPGQSADYMDKGEPPICIFHGTSDMVVNIREAYETKNRTDTVGIYSELYIFSRAGHNLLNIKINEICMRMDLFYLLIKDMY